MNRSTACRAGIICIVALFASIGYGSETPPASGVIAGIALPDDPEVAVIEFNIGYGHVLRWRGPYQTHLRVLADGRVIVGDPFGFANRRVGENIQPNPNYVPTIEGRISADELNALLGKAVGDYRLLDYDASAEIKRYRETQAMPVDANSESLVIRLKEKEHTCWLSAASVLSEADPKEFPHFRNFALMAKEMRDLRQRIINEYKANAQAAAATASTSGAIALPEDKQAFILELDASSGNIFKKRSEQETAQIKLRVDGTVLNGDP